MTEGLQGIKVIETASVLAGPMGGRLLADLGADVIHIDRPGTVVVADTSPNFAEPGSRTIPSHVNYIEQNTNCNKRRMSLDIASDTGRKILYRLLENADVFLTNFRPYELPKFQLEYRTLSRINPRLIQANLTAWGKNGPDRNMPGYDFNSFWTRSGIMHVLLTEDMPPFNTPVGMGDNITAITLAYGIVTALFIRERTGIGQQIDTSLLQAAVFANGYNITGALVTGADQQNVSRENINDALKNSYRTRDGRWLRIAINRPDRDWGKFCNTIGHPELENNPDYDTVEKKVRNHRGLFNVLEQVFAEKTLAEWRDIFTQNPLPWGPINTLPEVVADPQLSENGLIQPLIHPEYGKINIVGNPVDFNATPARISRPAPLVNEHTEQILLEHGYTREDIARFKAEQVI